MTAICLKSWRMPLKPLCPIVEDNRAERHEID